MAKSSNHWLPSLSTFSILFSAISMFYPSKLRIIPPYFRRSSLFDIFNTLFGNFNVFFRQIKFTPFRRSCDYRSTEHLDAAQQTPPELTLVLMGAPRTGKSALVNQFLWEGFLADYRPTVEEFNWVEYGRADQPESNFLLQLIDSSGSRDFLAMRHLYYRIGDAFMVG